AAPFGNVSWFSWKPAAYSRISITSFASFSATIITAGRPKPGSRSYTRRAPFAKRSSNSSIANKRLLAIILVLKISGRRNVVLRGRSSRPLLWNSRALARRDLRELAFAMTLDWSRIDTVLLDMDGTLLDLEFDNVLWNHRLPQRYAEHHRITHDDARER